MLYDGQGVSMSALPWYLLLYRRAVCAEGISGVIGVNPGKATGHQDGYWINPGGVSTMSQTKTVVEVGLQLRIAVKGNQVMKKRQMPVRLSGAAEPECWG